jgi:large subunit ribosomal protein L24e
MSVALSSSRSRWTKAFRKAHGKELTVDSTFDFERLRHRPIKYNRELMGKTIQAMQRIAEIKTKREQRFWQERMKDKLKLQKAEALRDLAQNIELAKPVGLDIVRKTQLVGGQSRCDFARCSRKSVRH